MRAQCHRHRAALAAVISIAACGGAGDLAETEDALAPGYMLFENSEALYVERCLFAPGPAGPAVGATCDGSNPRQGFKYDVSANRHWLQGQTTGDGACLTAAGARVLLQPCTEGAAAQAWTKRAISSSLSQYEMGASCLTLGANRSLSLAPCSGTRSQRWYPGNPRTLRPALLTGPLNEIGLIADVLPSVATVEAGPETIAASNGKILRWKIHPIAYQPKGVAQQNVGLIVTARDENDAPRAYVSAQIVRAPGTPNDFHAEWRVHIGGWTYFPTELLYVGGVVKKAVGLDPNSSADGATTVAMIRRDFSAVAADNTLVSSGALTKAEQSMLVARAIRPLSFLLLGIPAITAQKAAEQIQGWTQLGATAMTLSPANGFPGDGNAPPSMCAKTTKTVSGSGITAAACLSNPLVTPTGKACGYQDAKVAGAASITCNWVCCPLAL